MSAKNEQKIETDCQELSMRQLVKTVQAGHTVQVTKVKAYELVGALVSLDIPFRCETENGLSIVERE